MSDEPNAGHGEMLIETLSCLERSMEHVERAYPAVDHLSTHRVAPGEDELARVRGQIATRGSAALGDAFDRWWQVERDVRLTMDRLREMHQREPDSDPDYQVQLTECIHAAREARVALEDEAVELRRQIALEIDAADTH